MRSLPLAKQIEHDRAGRLQAAHQQGHGRDGRVAGDPLQVVGDQPPRQVDRAAFLEVVDDDRCEHDPPPGVARNAIALLHEQPGHARADRAQPDDGNFDVLHEWMK